MTDFNICFGCNDVGDVKTCSKKECVHYEFRNQSLSLDDEENERRTLLVKRTSREIMMYKTNYAPHV